MVIFHSYVKLPEGKQPIDAGWLFYPITVESWISSRSQSFAPRQHQGQRGGPWDGDLFNQNVFFEQWKMGLKQEQLELKQEAMGLKQGKWDLNKHVVTYTQNKMGFRQGTWWLKARKHGA